MAYPSTLDNFTAHSDGQTIYGAHVNELQTAIESMQAEIGTDPSGTYASLGARLAGAHAQAFRTRLDTDLIGRANRVMATPPTIGALATSSAISGGVRYAAGPVLAVANGAPSRAYFTWLCGAITQLGTAFPDYDYMRAGYVTDPLAGNGGPGAVEFLFDGTTLEIMTKGVTNTMWVSVDDEYVSASPTSIPNDGSTYYLPVTFSTRRWRKIRVELSVQTIFGGVQTGTNDTVVATQPATPRVIVHGDSFSEGGGGGYAPRPWWRTFGNAFGWHDIWSTSLGGTGWLATGPSGRPKLRNRLATDVYPYAPDILILPAGINDAGSTQQQIQDEVTATLAAIKTNLPNTLVVLSSPFWNSDPAGMANAWPIRDGIKAAALAAPGTIWVDLLEQPLYGAGVSTTLTAQATSGATTVSLAAPVARTTVIKLGNQRRCVTGISGSGPYTATLSAALDATVTSGSAVTEVGAPLWTGANLTNLVGADGTHPTQSGSDLIGVAFAQQLARVLATA